MRFIKRFVEAWFLADYLKQIGVKPEEMKDAIWHFRLFKVSKVYNTEAAAFEILLKTVRKAA
jgi:hypothetical protein